MTQALQGADLGAEVAEGAADASDEAVEEVHAAGENDQVGVPVRVHHAEEEYAIVARDVGGRIRPEVERCGGARKDDVQVPAARRKR